MGIFSNYENCEKRLNEYKIELHNYKKCLLRYTEYINKLETGFKEQEDQVKEYDDSLERYQNQLELYKERYENIIKDYDSMLKESTVTMVSRQDEIAISLNDQKQKNKSLKAVLYFSLIVNLISLSGIALVVLYILDII